MGGGLRRHPGLQPRLRPPLRRRAEPVPPQHAGGRPGRLGHRSHLPQRLGTGAVGGLRLPGPGERGPFRVPGLADHRPVEPVGHRAGPDGHLAAPGPLLPLPGPDQRPGPDGRVHPVLHHPHGRGHDGAEGAGRGVHPSVGGPIPLSHPELHRRHPGDRRGRHLHLREPGHPPPAGHRDRGTGRIPAHRLRPPRRPPAGQGPARIRAPVARERAHPVQDGAPRRHVARRRGRGLQPTRPAIGGRLRRQRPRHHRTQGVRGAAGPPRRARPADRAGQPAVGPRPGRADAGAIPSDRRPGRRVLHRPRQLQGRQRLAGPRGRRPAPPGGGGPLRRAPAGRRHRGPPRW